MGSTVKSPIGFEPFVRETYRNNAPPEVLGAPSFRAITVCPWTHAAPYARVRVHMSATAHFIKLMPDPWRRYQVAAEINFHELAVEALIELRHRRGLIEYIQRKGMRRPEYAPLVLHAESALRNPVRPRPRHDTARDCFRPAKHVLVPCGFLLQKIRWRSIEG